MLIKTKLLISIFASILLSSYTQSLRLTKCDKCHFEYPSKNYLYEKVGAYYKIEGNELDIIPKKRIDLINYRDSEIKHFNKIYYIDNLDSFFKQKTSDIIAYMNLIIEDLKNQDYETVYANILADKRADNYDIRKQSLKLKEAITNHNKNNNLTYFEEEESQDTFTPLKKDIKIKWTEERTIYNHQEDKDDKSKIKEPIVESPNQSKCKVHNMQKIYFEASYRSKTQKINMYDIDFQDVEILSIGSDDKNLNLNEIKLNCLHSFIKRFLLEIREDAIKYKHPFKSNIFTNQFISKLKYAQGVKIQNAKMITKELEDFKDFMDKYNKSYF